MTRSSRPAPSALLACLLLSSCGGGGGIGGAGGIGGTGGSVRLVNATPDLASLDLYESGNRVVSATALATASGYEEINAETYTFNLQVTGSTTVAASVNGAVEKRKHASVVAYTSGGALKAAFLTDEEGSPSAGTAKLRVFNAAKAEAGAVDVYLVGTPCAALESSSVAATASNVGDLQAAYTQLGAGSYHLCVTATGDKSDVRLDIPAFPLSDRQIVTLVLAKTSGGVLLNGFALNQQGTLVAEPNTSARVRVAAGVKAVDAAASGVATVGVTANGVALGNYASPDVGGYTLVPAGSLATVITLNGSPVPSSAASAAAGADLTLLVAGSAASPAVSVLVDDNTPSTSTGKPVKIRLVNGFARDGTVTLSVDGNNVGAGAGFGAASTSALVAASSQTTRLKATGTTGQLYLSDKNTLTSGSVYSLFLLGDPSATPPLAAGILRVDR